MAIVKSISGLRFNLNELNNEPNLIEKYANAFHLYLRAGAIAIGRDGRPSSENIMEQLIKILQQLGRDLLILDIVPTPTLQLFVESHRAAGGICITASHNPADWNGLKFINANGTFLDANESEVFWNYLDNKITENNGNFGNVIIANNAVEEHINKLLDLRFISARITNISRYLKEQNVKFAIDAVNSAGSFAVPMLLDRFNCDYEKLYCDNSGIFPHNPEPLPENLTALSDFIKHKKNLGEHYIGIAVDPDADRLVLVDENGNCVSEEKTICIAIDSYFTIDPSGSNVAVVNQSTTILAEWIANKYNKKIERSAVGEINVVKLMQKSVAKIGGEGSGGVILSEFHYGRDSLAGITLLLCLLSEKNIALKDLINTYPQYKMLKAKYNFDGDKEGLYNKLKTANKGREISTIDGIKIYYDSGWVHIRTSNTEPIIRIIAEAEDIKTAQMYLQNVEKLMQINI